MEASITSRCILKYQEHFILWKMDMDRKKYFLPSATEKKKKEYTKIECLIQSQI